MGNRRRVRLPELVAAGVIFNLVICPSSFAALVLWGIVTNYFSRPLDTSGLVEIFLMSLIAGFAGATAALLYLPIGAAIYSKVKNRALASVDFSMLESALLLLPGIAIGLLLSMFWLMFLVGMHST